MRIRRFQLQKSGNSIDEYEDASAYDKEGKFVAIADGASDAVESRSWARLLVQAFTLTQPEPNATSVLEWLSEPTRLWNERIDWEKLPWYAQDKARQGAFAAFLGVTQVENVGPYRWRAIAIGDVSLFQVRDDALIVSFPLKCSDEFGATPPLLSTHIEYSERSLKEMKVLQGECRDGDSLFLASDAFAAWFLSRQECGERPWMKFANISRDGLYEAIEKARATKQMRNDDVTVIAIDFVNCE